MKYLIPILILIAGCIPPDYVEDKYCLYCKGSLVSIDNTVENNVDERVMHTWCMKIFWLELEVRE